MRSSTEPRKNMRGIRRVTALGVIVSGLVLLTGTACNIVTPVAYAINGPGKIKKVTSLDPERSYVIFIDDPSSKVASRRLRAEIANTAQETLLKKGIVTNMIDGRSTFAVATGERYGERLSIQEIGQSVGADVVIYALLTNFTLGEDVGTYRPMASLQVKLIDSKTGDRIWPPEQGAMYPLRVNMPQKPGMVPATASEMQKAQQELAEYTGVALAQMFFDVEVPFSNRRR